MGIRTHLTAFVASKSKITNEGVYDRHWNCICFGKCEKVYDLATENNGDDGYGCNYEFSQGELEDFFNNFNAIDEQSKWALEEFNKFKITELYKQASFFELAVF